MSKTIRHYTVAADNRLRSSRGGCAAVWNHSNTIELTMTCQEIRVIEKRFFIDIEDVISDELMGKLLHHFRDEGRLLDEEAIRI